MLSSNRELREQFEELQHKIDKIQNGPALIEGDGLVALYPESDILISNELLLKAKKLQRVSKFVGKVFSAVCPRGVADVYQRSKSGRGHTSKKVMFSESIVNDLLVGARYHVKEKEVNYKAEVNHIVTTKLTCFNKLFSELKKGIPYSEKLVSDCKLSKDDVLQLKGLNDYKHNPAKFQELEIASTPADEVNGEPSNCLDQSGPTDEPRASSVQTSEFSESRTSKAHGHTNRTNNSNDGQTPKRKHDKGAAQNDHHKKKREPKERENSDPKLFWRPRKQHTVYRQDDFGNSDEFQSVNSMDEESEASPKLSKKRRSIDLKKIESKKRKKSAAAYYDDCSDVEDEFGKRELTLSDSDNEELLLAKLVKLRERKRSKKVSI